MSAKRSPFIKEGPHKRLPVVQIEPESNDVTVAVSLVATLVSFGIADIAFYIRAIEFEAFRQSRVEFAFDPPTHSPFPIIILLTAGGIAVREREWIVPFGVSAILCYFTMGGVVYSGPGDLLQAVMPLIEFRWKMLLLALVLNFSIVITWIVFSRRQKMAEMKSADQAGSA